MFRIIIGIFIVLHGLVHLLYFGQSARLFELQPGMVWPDGPWIFSRFLGNVATRNLASFFLLGQTGNLLLLWNKALGIKSILTIRMKGA